MDLDASLTLAGDPRSAAAGRRFVARTLTPLLGREDVETAVLLASELITDAAVRAGSACEVTLRGRSDLLQIRVAVADSRGPGRRRVVRDELAGASLRLLEVLCRRWGVDQDDVRKTVWCDLPVRGAGSRGVSRPARAPRH